MDPRTYPTNPVTGGPVAQRGPDAAADASRAATEGPLVVEDDRYERYDYTLEPEVDTIEAPAPIARRLDLGQWAFYAGLAGGVLILVAGFVAALFVTAADALDQPFLDATWQDAMLIGIWGLVTGAAVVLGALRVRERPDASGIPGLVMIAAGVLSFFALGGFFVGGLAAILAGVMAVASSRSMWRMPGPRVRDVA